MQGTMHAAVLKAPRELIVEEIPIPTIESDELLIEVAGCGICGSDIRYFAGENPWAQHTLGKAEPNPPNMVLGHEFGGTVVEAGSSHLESWIGKRVVVAPFDVSGLDRASRLGKPHLSKDTVHIGHGAGWGVMDYYPGAMARYCRAWARRCYVLPDHLSFDEAAVLDIAGVAYHALEVASVASGMSVAIIGMGPLGVTAARLANLRGAAHVFAVDIYDAPLEFARRSGARCFNAKQTSEWRKQVLELTDGWGVDAVLDTVGTAETFRDGSDLLAPDGTLVLLAVHAGTVSLPIPALAGERKITTSANYRYEDFQRTVDLAASEKLVLGDLVTHHVPLSRVHEGFDILRNKGTTGAMKVIVTP